MRILVTSGGTRVPIDEVRWLANRATGGLGASIARAWLRRGAEVTLLAAQNAKLPNLITIPADRWNRHIADQMDREAEHWRAWQPRYHPRTYATYHDYAEALQSILRTEPIDVCLLTAAVSDYAPIPQSGKLESEAPTRSLTLERLPKLIDRVKDWRPSVFLVGFKLLAGVDTDTLLMTARSAHQRTRSDITVANDSRSLDAGRHVLYLVFSDSTDVPAETLGPADLGPERISADAIFPEHPLADPLVDRIIAALQARSTERFPVGTGSGGLG